MASAYGRIKQIIFGRPLASERLEHERLNKKTALAVLSSDAISSVAYATDQILFVLGGAIGLAAVNYVVGISGVIVGLLVLVGLSYRQTVFAYRMAAVRIRWSTGLVSIIQLVTKFTTGGWIIAFIIPAIILVLRKIHRHYTEFYEEIRFTGQSTIIPLHHTVIVPVNSITKATAAALVYATTIAEEVIAVCIEVDKGDTDKMVAAWEAWDIGVPLEVVKSPYRSILKPLVEYVDNLRMVTPGELVTVVVPEIVPKKWWEHLLHNKTALFIRTAFLFKPNVVVTAVPYLVGHAYTIRQMLDHDEDLDAAEEFDGARSLLVETQPD
jgi:hypothetical protein